MNDGETQQPDPQLPLDASVSVATNGASISAAEAPTKRRQRRSIVRAFPPVPLEEVLSLPNAIQEHSSGQPIRRLTLLSKLGRSHTSSTTRDWITNSTRYGLTQGSYVAEFLSLTQDGKTATDPATSLIDQLRARFLLAVDRFPTFKALYEKYQSNRLPATEVLRDDLRTLNVAESDAQEGVDIFVKNLSFLGLLRAIGTSGRPTLIPIDQAIEELPEPQRGAQTTQTPSQDQESETAALETLVDFDHICFFIAPIGGDGTEERKHSNMVLKTLVEPALAQTGLAVVRADGIAKPGMISQQILEYILKSKLVVVDLSFHNPNVFYELALRHMANRPTVHLIRDSDSIPFDLANFRTIVINTTDKYELAMQIDSKRAQIANYAKEALAKTNNTNTNPVLTFFPALKVQL